MWSCLLCYCSVLFSSVNCSVPHPNDDLWYKNVEILKYEKLITFYFFYGSCCLERSIVSMIYEFAVLTGETLNFDIFIGGMGISIIFHIVGFQQRLPCLKLIMNWVFIIFFLVFNFLVSFFCSKI